MLKILFIYILASYLVAGEINIAVSANVSYAIKTLKEEFNKVYPSIKVRVTLGGSGKLVAQIKHGAPYNLFMSANMAYPQALYADKIAINKAKIYAQGSLAILSNKARDFSQKLLLLEAKDIDKIALANPKTAPYGKATIEALKNAHIYAKIKDKFVYAESISQTLSYTITATDIGFVAKSLLYSPRMSKFKEHIHWISLDKRLYKPINQGMVILKNAKNNRAVKAFYDFMLSRQAQEILHRFGYTTP